MAVISEFFLKIKWNELHIVVIIEMHMQIFSKSEAVHAGFWDFTEIFYEPRHACLG